MHFNLCTTTYSFIDLLKLVSSPDKLIDKLKSKHNKLTRIKFRYFIESVVKNSCRVRVTCVDKLGCNYNYSEPTYEEYKFLLKELDKCHVSDMRKIEQKGKLIGVDVETCKFGLKTSDDKIIIRGDLSKGMRTFDFNIKSFVIAHMTVQEEVNILTDFSKMNYQLFDVKIL